MYTSQSSECNPFSDDFYSYKNARGVHNISHPNLCSPPFGCITYCGTIAAAIDSTFGEYTKFNAQFCLFQLH